MKVAIIFKNMGIGFLGVFVIALLLIVANYFDKHLLDNNFVVGFTSVSWSVYVVSKAYLELSKKLD